MIFSKKGGGGVKPLPPLLSKDMVTITPIEDQQGLRIFVCCPKRYDSKATYCVIKNNATEEVIAESAISDEGIRAYHSFYMPISSEIHCVNECTLTISLENSRKTQYLAKFAESHIEEHKEYEHTTEVVQYIG